MTLRRDFLIHKARTVESFRLAKADIINTNANLENLTNLVRSLESKISLMQADLLSIKMIGEKSSSDLISQQISVNGFKEQVDDISERSMAANKNASKSRKESEKLTLKIRSQGEKFAKLQNSMKKEITMLKKALRAKISTVKKVTSTRKEIPGRKSAVKTTVKTIESTVKP